MLAILILIFVIILVLELPTLLRQKRYRALAVFAVFYLFGVYLVLAQFYHWIDLNPFEALLAARGISGWYYV